MSRTRVRLQYDLALPGALDIASVDEIVLRIPCGQRGSRGITEIRIARKLHHSRDQCLNPRTMITRVEKNASLGPFDFDFDV